MTPAEYDRYSTPLTNQPVERLNASRQDLHGAVEFLWHARGWASKEGGCDISAEVDEACEAIERARLKVEARRAEVERG